jgi:hypothetical protein
MSRLFIEPWSGMVRQRRSLREDMLVFDKSTVRVFSSFEEADQAAREYWLLRTPAERMAALEHIRQLAWGYNADSRPKFPRSPELLKLRRRPLSGARRIRG